MKVMGCGFSPYTNFRAKLTVLNANKEAESVVDEHKSEWESRAKDIGDKKDNIYVCIMPGEYAPVGEKVTKVYTPVAAFANINGRDYYDDLSLSTIYDAKTEDLVPYITNRELDEQVINFMDNVNYAYKNPDRDTRLSSPR